MTTRIDVRLDAEDGDRDAVLAPLRAFNNRFTTIVRSLAFSRLS